MAYDDAIPKNYSNCNDRPLVTIVIATFNRANILELVLKSLQSQTFEAWEALIVGDNCSDNTEKVVMSFNENRFKFINLRFNTGDQSGPNSIGSRFASGEYIAFLNHDDFWFPDHLDIMVSTIKSKMYDLLIAPSYSILNIENSPSNKFLASVQALNFSKNFSPVAEYPFVASCWIMKTQLCKQIGDWVPATQVRYASSQEFLYRCWLSGAKIGLSNVRTVVIIPSAIKSDTYANLDYIYHEQLLPFIVTNDKQTIEKLVIKRSIAHPYRISRMIYSEGTPNSSIRRFVKNYADSIYQNSARLTCRFGISSWEFAAFLLGIPKGGTNKILRKGRGLESR